MEISNQTRLLAEYALAKRRALHALPELSDQEVKTGAYIAAELKTLGLKFRRIHTGVVCDIKGKTNRTLAFRADMDALPIKENTGRQFASGNGCMHACGHDGHMAMLLCAAKHFSTVTPNNSLRLIFQFGEEGTGGAEKMVRSGCLENVSEVFAFHVDPFLPQGELATAAGAIFAGAVEFDVAFEGHACHCADKEKGADAVSALCEYAYRLNGANDKYRAHTLLHTGKIEGGSARNIVADFARAQCTLRYFDDAHKEDVMMRIAAILNDIDNAKKTEHRLTVNAVYPPLINGASAVGRLKAVLPELKSCAPRFTAEDFAFMAQAKPSCMAWLGTRTDKYFSPLHSDTFDFDETALLYGIEAYLRLADS